MTTAPSHRAPGPPTAGHRRPPVDPVLLDRLDGQVRDVVRREGIDPQRGGRLVRRIVEDVVRAHDDLSLTGQVVPLGDPVLGPDRAAPADLGREGGSALA